MKTIGSVALIVALVVGMSGFASADAGDVLKAHFKAVGGLEKLSAIKTIQRSGDATMGGMVGEMSGTTLDIVLVGKKSYTETKMDMFSESTHWNGTSGWKSSEMGGTVPLSSDEIDTAKNLMFLDPVQGIYEELGASGFEQGEDETIGGRECAVLSVVDAGLSFFFDKETMHVAALKLAIDIPNLGAADIVISYSDYSEYGGVMLPNSVGIDVSDGMVTIDRTYTKTELDVEVDEAIFEKP